MAAGLAMTAGGAALLLLPGTIWLAVASSRRPPGDPPARPRVFQFFPSRELFVMVDVQVTPGFFGLVARGTY